MLESLCLRSTCYFLHEYANFSAKLVHPICSRSSIVTISHQHPVLLQSSNHPIISRQQYCHHLTTASGFIPTTLLNLISSASFWWRDFSQPIRPFNSQYGESYFFPDLLSKIPETNTIIPQAVGKAALPFSLLCVLISCMFMSVHAHVRACLCACVLMCVHAHVRAHVCACSCTCVHMCMLMCVCAYVRAHVHANVRDTSLHSRAAAG
jgi:hypothetical protein